MQAQVGSSQRSRPVTRLAADGEKDSGGRGRRDEVQQHPRSGCVRPRSRHRDLLAAVVGQEHRTGGKMYRQGTRHCYEAQLLFRFVRGTESRKAGVPQPPCRRLSQGTEVHICSIPHRSPGPVPSVLHT